MLPNKWIYLHVLLLYNVHPYLCAAISIFQYLPVFNIALTAVGVYMFIIASRCIKKKGWNHCGRSRYLTLHWFPWWYECNRALSGRVGWGLQSWVGLTWRLSRLRVKGKLSRHLFFFLHSIFTWNCDLFAGCLLLETFIYHKALIIKYLY